MRQFLALLTVWGGRSWLAASLLLAAAPAWGQQAATCYASHYRLTRLPRLRTEILGREFQRAWQANCWGCGRPANHVARLRQCNRRRLADLRVLMTELEARLNGQPLAVVRQVMGQSGEAGDSTLAYRLHSRATLYFTANKAGVAVSSWVIRFE